MADVCSLAFTALTSCSFYQGDANWVLNGNWVALEDATPRLFLLQSTACSCLKSRKRAARQMIVEGEVGKALVREEK